MRLWLAIRIFFAVLFSSRLAPQVERLLQEAAEQRKRLSAGPSRAHPAPATDLSQMAQKPAVAPAPPARNDALTLLAALQREARFVDIVKEPLGEYSDEQIGAAARDVLRDCGSVLDRLFAIRPLVEDAEGAELVAPADFDANRYRLTGNVVGDPPYKGRLVHHGWQATRCELPKWSGSAQGALVVAPIELELPGSVS